MKLPRLILLSLATIACGGGGGSTVTGPNPPNNPTPSSANVSMRSEGDIYGEYTHSFSPANVSVARGGQVTWTNSTNEQHNVTFAGAGAPASIANHTSGSNSRTFASSGTFDYSCTNHPGMAGRVTVP